MKQKNTFYAGAVFAAAAFASTCYFGTASSHIQQVRNQLTMSQPYAQVAKLHDISSQIRAIGKDNSGSTLVEKVASVNNPTVTDNDFTITVPNMPTLPNLATAIDHYADSQMSTPEYERAKQKISVIDNRTSNYLMPALALSLALGAVGAFAAILAHKPAWQNERNDLPKPEPKVYRFTREI